MRIVMTQSDIDEAIAAWAVKHGMRGNLRATWEFEMEVGATTQRLVHVVLTSADEPRQMRTREPASHTR